MLVVSVLVGGESSLGIDVWNIYKAINLIGSPNRKNKNKNRGRIRKQVLHYKRTFPLDY